LPERGLSQPDGGAGAGPRSGTQTSETRL
jgi:hypothetical protein